MVNTVLLNLYVTLAVAATSVGAKGVEQFVITKATIEAQAVVVCPAPAPPTPPRRSRGLPATGNVPSTTGGRAW